MIESRKIYDIHADHTQWLNKLAFYADDIKVIRNRIEEVASKNTGMDVMVQVEHFQNILIIQQNEIDKLKHNIKAHDHSLEMNINNNMTAVDHRKAEHWPQEQESLEIFERLFNEMRRELYTFLSRVM